MERIYIGFDLSIHGSMHWIHVIKEDSPFTFLLYLMNLLTVLDDSSLTQDSHKVTPNHLQPLSPQLVVVEGAFTTDPARNRHL